MSLMLYVNLVTAPGVENFFAAAKDAGVDAVLIPDVPIQCAKPNLNGTLPPKRTAFI